MKDRKSGSFFKRAKSNTDTNDKPRIMETGKWECTNCGALNNESVKYCPSCGQSK